MQHAYGRYEAPAVTKTAFNCPHCGSLAKQFWHVTYVQQMSKDHVPDIIRKDEIEDRLRAMDENKDEDTINFLRDFLLEQSENRAFVSKVSKIYTEHQLSNLFISCCYNCDNVSIWIRDRLLWPQIGADQLPNSDLPIAVRADFEEASRVLETSPRSAAALLRLAIQTLCMELGEKGKNLNDDIAALVKKGLDERVQRALDIVRVIGNNAVHPGELDLRDDRATAETLFSLVNLIAEKLITEPRHVDEVYRRLPEGALRAINKRDGSKD